MMSILKKLLVLGGAMVAMATPTMFKGHSEKVVRRAPVKFSKAPSECSEDEHQRRNQAAIEKRERKASKLRARS